MPPGCARLHTVCVADKMPCWWRIPSIVITHCETLACTKQHGASALLTFLSLLLTVVTDTRYIMIIATPQAQTGTQGTALGDYGGGAQPRALSSAPADAALSFTMTSPPSGPHHVHAAAFDMMHDRYVKRNDDNVDVHGAHHVHHGSHGLGFVSPDQVQSKHQKVVMWEGRLGWIGKGLVYAILGGLSIQSASNAEENTNSVSPQGAFVLVGSNTVGIPLLAVMAGLLFMYIIWRLHEGVTGQGYDAEWSNFKNFFKFRLSPFVSGAVYLGYNIFILQLIVKIGTGEAYDDSADSDFTLTWSKSAAGKAGLALLGIAFLIGFLVQMDWAFRSGWHRDYRDDAPRWLMLIILGAGHVGYAARGGVFLAVSVLFFKQVANTYQIYDPAKDQVATIDNALGQLRESPGLRALLWILGFFLVVYGTFAVVSGGWARIYPTPPPSRKPKMRPGEAPVIYQIKGNRLHKVAPLVEPIVAAAMAGDVGAAADVLDMEQGKDVQAGHVADTQHKLGSTK